MFDHRKYRPEYFLPPDVTCDWVRRDRIEAAPRWCSVDLRDGNQALTEPMGIDEKLEFFKLLVDIGFKEIEVGFPAASDTEFNFVRRLIDEHHIPEDVTIQVLTQSREPIIRRSFDAVRGARRAVVHLYNSVSAVQREQVFRKSREEIRRIAAEGAALCAALARETPGGFLFEYSPESFPGTEIEYALEVCHAVLELWNPTPEHPAIINLPATVENALPHVFASQVEYFHKNLHPRDAVVLSLHPHNDRGGAVADAELGVLAGAQRLEGTLFGNGERTGNLDIITCAMNLYAHGVDPRLDLSRMDEIRDLYERLTQMEVAPRHPYAGALVFTAFSGSHQDAIAKGIAWRGEHDSAYWQVPYLPIDPADIGREYGGNIIRINSQSGKGGISFILRKHYGIILPERMKEAVSRAVKSVSDHAHSELTPEWVYQIFIEHFVRGKCYFQITETHFRSMDGIQADITLATGGEETIVSAGGNGRLDAVSNAIKKHLRLDYNLISYEEHALTTGSTSQAVTYVGIVHHGKHYWGAGIHPDILDSSVNALAVAVNQIEGIAVSPRDERVAQITQYIRDHYRTVTLGELSKTFFLTVPYLSKLLKEKTGMNYTDIVKAIRLKKARALLKSTGLTVERVADEVGYQNVENFNRLFKQSFGMTPAQYRREK